MKDRKRKQEDLDALHKALAESANVFVTGFNKLTVAQDYELRKAVRQVGGLYEVVKNTLAGKASAGAPAEAAVEDLKGLSAVAYTQGRSGHAVQGADRVRQSQSDVHLQGGRGGGPGDQPGRHQGSGQHAVQGSDLRPPAVRDKRNGAAPGDGDRRRGPESGRGGRPGRAGKQILFLTGAGPRTGALWDNFLDREYGQRWLTSTRLLSKSRA